MKLTVFRELPFSAETVWAALTDAKILRQCIPGCHQVVGIDHARWRARFNLMLGPQQTPFRAIGGIVMACPPECYVLRFVIKNDTLGTVRGTAEGRLVMNEAQTMTTLRYDLAVQMSGSLAEAPFHFIDATLLRLSNLFFEQFIRCVAKQEGGGGVFSEFLTSLLGKVKKDAVSS